jgi:hypothetical protein
MNSTPRFCSSLPYHAAASVKSVRTERRNDTDRLISGCEPAPSPLPHSEGLRHRDLPHAPKAAGRAQPSELPSDPVRRSARQCCLKALRPIRSVLPQIDGKLDVPFTDATGVRMRRSKHAIGMSVGLAISSFAPFVVRYAP